GCPRSVSASYGVQWAVSLDASGLTGDASGTVVTVGASDTIAAGSLPATRWVNDGGSISYSYAQTVGSSVDGKRFNRTSGPSPTSPISGIGSPQSVTAGYGVQWAVRFAASGLGADASGAVVSVGATPETYGPTAFASSSTVDYWVNNAGSLSYSYADPVGSSVTGKRYNLTNTPGTSV